jgi:hypothetical protein
MRHADVSVRVFKVLQLLNEYDLASKELQLWDPGLDPSSKEIIGF